MAAILQLRRGTTASKPTLSAGEMYVNTTSQSLQLGIDGSTEITLAKLNSVNSGSFNVSGDITLGGTITIGDTTSDNIVFNADLSSSLIPNNDNSFDLGSTSFRYRNVNATSISGAIASTNGVVSGSSQVIGILTSLNSFSASNGNTSLNSYTSSQDTKNSTLATYTGSIDGKFTTLQTLTASYSSSIGLINSFTASNGNTSLNSYTASQDTKNTTLATTSGSLITSQSNATIAVSNLNTFTSSVNVHITDINSKTGSYATTGSNTFIGNQTISTGSIILLGRRFTDQPKLTISASDDTLRTIVGLNTIQVYSVRNSASVGINNSFGAGISAFVDNQPSASVSLVLGTKNTGSLTTGVQLYLNVNSESGIIFNDYNTITDNQFSPFMRIAPNNGNNPNVEFSRSVDISGSLTSNGFGVLSGSSQITAFGFISSSAAIPAGTISGSAQLPSGLISGSTQLTSSFDGRYLLTGSVTSSILQLNSFTSSLNIWSSSVALTGSNSFNGNQTITGSLLVSGSNTVIGTKTITGSIFISGSKTIIGSLTITGSAKGNIVPITIASSTASLDMNAGSYFTLTLANTATTHIRATNITPGTTATLLITTGTNSSASLAPTLLQPSGSFYTASLGSGKKDVLSLVSFDTTNMYVVSTKAMQ